MTNIKNLTKEHEELILNLTPEELETYVENISKKKIDSLGFFTAEDVGNNLTNVEDYNKFSGMEEDLINIFVNNAPDKINKEYKRAVATGLTLASDYETLKEQYFKQIHEAKKLFFQRTLTEVVYISKAIIFNVNYLTSMLGYFYLLRYNETEEKLIKIDLIFNSLIESIYLELESYIDNLEPYKIVIKLEEDSNSMNEELAEIISNIATVINCSMEYVKQLEELKANPFEEPSKYVAMDYISKVFETEVEDLDSFKESLSSEEELEVVNVIFEGFTTNIASYDFENFCIIEPEGAVN